MPSRADDLPEGTAARADATFVTHATWAPMRTAGMLARVAPDLVLADSGLSCDTFNIVCRARLAAAGGMQRCRDAVAHFHGARRPFSWWVGPADEPQGLGTMLEAVGLERAETELAMAMRLDKLPGRHPEVPGLEVRRVRTTAQLESWAQVTASNWTPPDAGVLSFYRLTAPALLDPDAPQWLYLGLLDGAAVATAEATVAAAPRRRGRGMPPRRAAGRSRGRRGVSSARLRDVRGDHGVQAEGRIPMIRKLADGRYRLYSRKRDPRTGKRRNLGTFASRAAAEKHERAVQYFKRRG